MDPTLIGIAGALALLALIGMGVHIGAALLIVGLVGNTLILGFEPALWTTVGSSFGRIINAAFLPLPLFIYLGLLASKGGLGHEIYDVLKMWVGRLRGSAGVATVGSCAAFGTVCGSSLVTASVFAKISAPEMRRQGYDKNLAYGICSSAGIIGMLIPPNVLAVIYALVAELSLGELLVAGIVPGILVSIVFSATIVYVGYRNPAAVGGAESGQVVSWRQRFSALKMLWPIYILMGTVFGGIFTGVFSPNEAAGVAAAVMLIIVVLTMGKDRWSELWRVTLDATSVNAMIFLILMGATAFSDLMVTSGIAANAISFVTGLGLPGIGFVLALIAIYLVMGCFLDSTSIITITVPLLIPIARSFHFDLVWFATISIVAIELGLITPPVGLNVYAVKGVAERDVSLEDCFRGVMPFFFGLLVVLAILLAFPELITYLPGLMRSR